MFSASMKKGMDKHVQSTHIHTQKIFKKKKKCWERGEMNTKITE